MYVCREGIGSGFLSGKGMGAERGVLILFSLWTRLGAEMGRALAVAWSAPIPSVTAGWTASNCLVTEDSRLPLVSLFFLICPLDSSLPLLVACSSVTNLTQTLEAVPHSEEGLCLSGSTSVLCLDDFSHFPGLKVLGLSLHLTQLLPGALGSSGQLQQLFFTGPYTVYLFLPLMAT